MATYINADDGIVSGVAGLKYGADNSGNLVFQTNGTTAISISAAQAVTFTGTVSFATASFTNLSYTGTFTGGTGVVNLGSGQFYKDASGNVGIGNSTPAQKLQIGTTGVDAFIRFGATSNGYDIGRENSSGNFVQNATQASPYNVFIWQQSGTERMRIANNGYVGINTTTPSGIFDAYVASTTRLLLGYNGTSSNYYDADTQIFRSGTAVERMRIDASGNVNIGAGANNNVYDQVASGRPLVVQSSSSTTTLNGSTNAITISNSDTTTGNSSQLNFATITGASTNQYTSAVISCIYGARTNGQYATGQLTFSTSTTLNSAPTEKMRIDSSGNVGIGTSSPSGFFDANKVGVARILAGFGGTSSNYYDADTHNFRNAGATGTLTIGSTGNITLPYANSSILNSSGRKMLNQTGGILQVLQTVKSDTFSITTSSTWQDITGMSVTITPSSTSSTILVMADIAGNGTSQSATVRLVRNSTAIFTGNAASNRPLGSANWLDNSTFAVEVRTIVYLDSPATSSAVTYKLQVIGSSATWYLNRSATDRDTTSYDPRTASSITVMEIAG